MSDASSRPPGSTWHRRRSQLAAAGAALLTLVLCLAPLGASRATAADDSSSARISLNANAPEVSTSGQPVVVSGTITNTGSSPIADPVVHLLLNSALLLDTRSAAEDWMSGKLDVPVSQVATGSTVPVDPGSTTSFAVTIPGSKLKFSYGLAALPLSITVTDGRSSAASAIRGTARSTLHQQNAPVKAPLRLSVVIPLTLPADPQLFGPAGTARTAAWERAIGPDSTVQQTLDAFAGMPVVFAVDPELIDPPAAADDNVPAPTPTPSSSSSGSGSAGSSTGSATSSPPTPTSTAAAAAPTTAPDSSGSGVTTGGATSAQSSAPRSSTSSTTTSSTAPPTTPAGRIATAVGNLADRLDNLDRAHSVWWLPTDDPDLVALHAAGARGRALLTRDLSSELPAAARRTGAIRAVWPAGDAPAAVVTSSATQLSSRDNRAIAVLPDRALAPSATGATHRLAGSSAVLTYDERLSRLFSAPSTSPGTQTSRLLTQLLAIYQQSPGTPRSLALVAPRTGAADPTQLAAQVSALQTAAWVQLRTGGQTRAALATAPTTTLLGRPRAGAPYPAAPVPAVTAGELRDLDLSRDRLAALQRVLVGGDQVLPRRTRALDIIGSARWRGAPAKLESVAHRDGAAVSAMLAKLSIRSSTINFFADSGDISVTVSNQLARPVRGVLLYLQPRKYLVQVSDAEKTINIEAGAHATARFHIKAVGAGTVPVDAMLRAPNGASLGPLGAPSQLKINVHPTSGWIMWVLGALAALILVIGLWRAARRGPRTASGPAPAGQPTPNEAIVDAGPTTQRPTDDETAGDR